MSLSALPQYPEFSRLGRTFVLSGAYHSESGTNTATLTVLYVLGNNYLSCMYAHVNMCIHTCQFVGIYTLICGVYIHAHLWVWRRIYIRIYIPIYTYIYVYLYIYVYKSIYIGIYTGIYIRIYACPFVGVATYGC